MSRCFFNISKLETPPSLGNLCQCLVPLTVKKCFSLFRGNLSPLSLCPLPPVTSPVTEHHWNEPGSVLCVPSVQGLVHIDKIPQISSPGFPSSRLNSPSSLKLSPQEKCSRPFTISMAIHWTPSSMSMLTLGSPAHSMCGLTRVEQKGRITSSTFWQHEN